MKKINRKLKMQMQMKRIIFAVSPDPCNKQNENSYCSYKVGIEIKTSTKNQLEKNIANCQSTLDRLNKELETLINKIDSKIDNRDAAREEKANLQAEKEKEIENAGYDIRKEQRKIDKIQNYINKNCITDPRGYKQCVAEEKANIAKIEKNIKDVLKPEYDKEVKEINKNYDKKFREINTRIENLSKEIKNLRAERSSKKEEISKRKAQNIKDKDELVKAIMFINKAQIELNKLLAICPNFSGTTC